MICLLLFIASYNVIIQLFIELYYMYIDAIIRFVLSRSPVKAKCGPVARIAQSFVCCKNSFYLFGGCVASEGGSKLHHSMRLDDFWKFSVSVVKWIVLLARHTIGRDFYWNL